MITFLVSIILLLVGYFIYGKYIETTFGIDDRQTPAYKYQDDVDYIPMNSLKVYLIQFLNIAGIGPIFGPIMGALYGPVAFLWIVLGSIFAGGVHDYMSGMISVRNDGKSIAEITGVYLGNYSRYFMLFMSVVLLLFVGVVFIVSPAALLANLTFDTDSKQLLNIDILSQTSFWIVIIFIYYFISTILPIDKVIGKLYPFFGALLMFMAFSICGMMIYQGIEIPEITQMNNFSHPNDIPIWPALFFTISCGAISGFHATQSPLMARTIRSENTGRKVFYGAMITEAVIAMIWAAISMSYFPNGVDGLNDILTQGGPGLVVNNISIEYLGIFGGYIAILGVIIAPITSGDTAFRSIRLTLSDHFNISQAKICNRLIIAVPIFLIAYFITKIDFHSIWMYFSFFNQLLATMALWTATAYLYKNNKNIFITLLPAIFMSFNIVGYILISKEFPFELNYDFTTIIISSAITSILSLYFIKKRLLN